jgi:hypothetical protein
MFYDPDDERSIEEMIQNTWDHKLSDTKKAQFLAAAAAQGCHWFDLVMQRMEQILDEMTDPITGPQWRARFEAQRLPFGKDPLLRKDGEP